MKNRKVLFIFLILALALITACKDDTPSGNTQEDPECKKGAHLGIGENCDTTGAKGCGGLKNYNTSTGDDAFPVPIYRVGPESNFAGATKTIEETAENIWTSYADLLEPFEKDDIKAGRPDQGVKLTQVQIFNISGKYYSWDKNILSLNIETAPSAIGAFLRMAGNGTLPELAQLQPMINEIRLAAAGQKQSKTPLIAGGNNDKLPALTAAKGFEMNRNFIRRNNNIAKNMARQSQA